MSKGQDLAAGMFPCHVIEEREPAETLPGRKTDTDRVCEKTSEGFRLAETGRAGQRGTDGVSLWLLYIGEFESTAV